MEINIKKIDQKLVNFLPKDKIIIGEPLGHGGFGLVESGYYKSLKLAIKKVSNTGDYLKEINVLQALKHSNVPLFYGMYSTDIFAHLVIEKIEGLTLDKLLTRLNSLTSTNNYNFNNDEILLYKLIIAINITTSLEYLHFLGIIHRDIKPNNIMINNKHQVKLLDFGISKSDINTCSVTNPRTGTLIYLSPEFFPLPDEDIVKIRVNYKSDIWALGLVLNELFSGEKPWGRYLNYSVFQVMGLIYNREQFPVSEDLCPELKEIITKCTLYNKEERYDATKVKNALLNKFYSLFAQMTNNSNSSIIRGNVFSNLFENKNSFLFLSYLFQNNPNEKHFSRNRYYMLLLIETTLVYYMNYIIVKNLDKSQIDNNSSKDLIFLQKKKSMIEHISLIKKQSSISISDSSIDFESPNSTLSLCLSKQISHQDYYFTSNNHSQINFLREYFISKSNLTNKENSIKFHFLKKHEIKEEITQILPLFNYQSGKYFAFLTKNLLKSISVYSLGNYSNKIKSDFDLNKIFYLSHYLSFDMIAAYKNSFLYFFQIGKNNYIKKSFIFKQKNIELEPIRYSHKNSFNCNIFLFKQSSDQLILFYSLEEEKILQRVSFATPSPLIFDFYYFQNTEDIICTSAGDKVIIIQIFNNLKSKNKYDMQIKHQYDGIVMFYRIADICNVLTLIVSLNKSHKDKVIEIWHFSDHKCYLKIDYETSIIKIDYFSCKLNNKTCNNYIIAHTQQNAVIFKFNSSINETTNELECEEIKEDKSFYLKNCHEESFTSNNSNKDKKCSFSNEFIYPKLIANGFYSSSFDKRILYCYFHSNHKRKGNICTWLQGYEII